jgi:hypothetical protein
MVGRREILREFGTGSATYDCKRLQTAELNRRWESVFSPDAFVNPVNPVNPVKKIEIFAATSD